MMVMSDRWEIVGEQPEMAAPLFWCWGTPTPCFGKRGCKRLKTKGGRGKKRAKRKQEAASSWEQRSSTKRRNTERTKGNTPGVLYGCENNGVAGKWIWKFLILKARGDSPQRARGAQRFEGRKTGSRWEAIFTVYDSTQVNRC